jgi:hypothetical protein
MMHEVNILSQLAGAVHVHIVIVELDVRNQLEVGWVELVHVRSKGERLVVGLGFLLVWRSCK